MTSFSHFSVTIDCVRFPIRRFLLYTYSMGLGKVLFSKKIKLRYSSGTLTFNFIYLYKIISDKDPYRVTIEEASLIKEIYTVHNLQKYFPIALYIVFGGVKAL